MNTQLRNMLEARLKPPTAPKDMMAYHMQQKEGSNKPALTVDPIFGNIFINPAGGQDVLVGKQRRREKCAKVLRGGSWSGMKLPRMKKGLLPQIV